MASSINPLSLCSVEIMSLNANSPQLDIAWPRKTSLLLEVIASWVCYHKTITKHIVICLQRVLYSSDFLKSEPMFYLTDALCVADDVNASPSFLCSTLDTTCRQYLYFPDSPCISTSGSMFGPPREGRISGNLIPLRCNPQPRKYRNWW